MDQVSKIAWGTDGSQTLLIGPSGVGNQGLCIKAHPNLPVTSFPQGN